MESHLFIDNEYIFVMNRDKSSLNVLKVEYEVAVAFFSIVWQFATFHPGDPADVRNRRTDQLNEMLADFSC